MKPMDFINEISDSMASSVQFMPSKEIAWPDLWTSLRSKVRGFPVCSIFIIAIIVIRFGLLLLSRQYVRMKMSSVDENVLIVMPKRLKQKVQKVRRQLRK